MNLQEAGIPKRTATALNKKGLYTLDDLARFFPRKYHDYRKIMPLLETTLDCAIGGYMEDIVKDQANNRSMIKASIIEATSGEKVRVLWFGQAHKWDYLKELKGTEVVICGTVKYDAAYGYSICNPEYIGFQTTFRKRMVPVYPKIKGVSEENLMKCIKIAIDSITEPLEKEIIEKNGWMGYKNAILNIHHPKDPEIVKEAQERIAINDLLYFTLELKSKPMAPSSSRFIVKNLSATEQMLKELPFKLTVDQRSTFATIKEDMVAGRRANYLIQGDVSCGKTIVAFLCAMMMADNKYQTAIMAPTAVLAMQHYEEIKQYADKYGKKAVYLGQGLKASEKKKVLKDISDGDADFIIGTHSVIGKDVSYKQLGLVITDEEHRFGVKQREELLKKANGMAHVLSMSATPIPRTVASVIYGEDKKISTIKSMPGGRKPVMSYINNDDEQILRFIEQEVRKGHQAYIVCPMIEEADDDSKTYDVRSVDETAVLYRSRLSPRGISVEAINGKMKKAEMETILENFRSGITKVLVSTTVIEVGVNVPNANVMVISNAERFGLATLHQLRGRVGRGSDQAYCILKSEDRANERLQIMKKTTDGFEIAKEDLRIRGMGDLLGTQQSGSNRMLDLAISMPDLYEKLRVLADSMIKKGQGNQLIELYKEKEDLMYEA